MRRSRYLVILSVTAATLFLGFATFATAADEPHPLAGTWEHAIDTSEGYYRGTITITVENEVLSGTIGFDSPPSDPTSLNDITFDGAELIFRFDTQQYGMARVKVAVDGDSFKGTVDVPDADAYGLFISGTRDATQR